MNEQHPGGSPGGQDYNPGSGDTPPSPFSREAAGENAGLGPVPDPSSTEPEGFVGHPDGPVPDQSSAAPYPPASDPYGSSTYSPGYYSAGSSSSASEASAGSQAPYAPPAGAATPADPYGSANPGTPAAAPADQGYGAVQGFGSGGQPAYPPNPYDTGGYSYQSAPYGFPTEQHPQGTTSLVLGILGITICPPAGVVGFVISNRARREIQATPGRYSNSGMVTAGWVLGIIALVMTAFWVLYLLVVIIALIATGGS